MSVERILTGAIVIFGLVFLFWIIPQQVETVSYGRIVPSTIPSIIGWMLVIVATFQLFTSQKRITIDIQTCLRAMCFVALLVVSVWLMDKFSFEAIASLMVLSMMLMMGERRWYWLLLSGIIIPISVWLIVERVLDRVLA